MIESKKSTHGRQIGRDDFHIWQRGELPVASIMIAMFMGVHDKQGKAYPILGRQNGEDRLRKRHFLWIRDSAGVDEKRLLRSNEQVKKVRLRADARILP